MSTANPTGESLRLAQRITAALSGEREMLHQVRETFPPHRVPDDLADRLNEWTISAGVLTQWEKNGRQVLSVHDELVESIRFAGSSKIVPEVFRTLPYLNPMVVFPSPPKIKSHTKGETLRVVGFLTYGIPHPRTAVLSTHDPEADTLGVYVVIEITREDDPRNPVLEFDYISFPMDGKPLTLSETVDVMMSRFVWNHGEDNPSRNRFMRELISLVVGAIMYLCSTTLDAEKVPRKAVLKALGNPPRAPFSMYRVGWQIGAALSRARKTVKVEEPSQQIKPGYEQDPQHRRAHFKTVWTGKGSMIPKTVFIAPYWTHVEKLGDKGVNTVRRVKVENG